LGMAAQKSIESGQAVDIQSLLTSKQ
jgi:hypothetical protein